MIQQRRGSHPGLCTLAWVLAPLCGAAPGQTPGQAPGATPGQAEPARGVRVDEPEAEAPATYGRRHALVVGVDDYVDPRYPDLGFAAADASAVAGVLVERFGFEREDVRLLLNGDATRRALSASLEEWISDRNRIGEDDLVVIYFAGHGMTRELGGRGARGYLVPVDGRAEEDGEPAWSSLIGMNFLEDVSEAIPAKHALFLLDCCFGGLAVTRAAPPVAAGLKQRARQVLTGGSQEETVLDGGGAGHSVFTGALLEALGGAADDSGDNVISFGELYGHVSEHVVRKTEGRQTPLQSNFADHGGGCVALFPPGVVPGGMSAAERMKNLERSSEQQLAELKRLQDAILVEDLLEEAEALWPQYPETLPAYRAWLARARELMARLPQHEASVRLVRQEAYLSQVLAGRLVESEHTEPEWELVDPELRWRHETFRELVETLAELAEDIASVERRVAVASTLRQRSIDEHAEEWAAALASIRSLPVYAGLSLEPQIGLVPIGPDPHSGLWEFAHILTGDIPERDAGGDIVWTGSSALVLVLIPGGSFLMGAQKGDPDAPNYDPEATWDEYLDEVDLPPFFISKLELTQGQWLCFTGENPSELHPGNSPVGMTFTLLHPVEKIGWKTAAMTLGRIGLALPPEAFWEYAARAGTDTPWWTGKEKQSLLGAVNLADQAAARVGLGWPEILDFQELDDGYAAHAPANAFRPNAFGLHNVHGNVSEWCRLDGFRTGERGGEAAQCRGGSYRDGARKARSANRMAENNYVGPNVGVRPVRSIDP